MKYDICVFGGCSLDQTYYQKIDGTYNETPDLISPGGKGANQAVAAAKAGAKTTIISRIGKDDIGDKIINNLTFFGVDTSNIEIENGLSNDYGNIYINLKDKDNEIKRFNGAINSFTKEMVEKYKDVLLNSKIIVCQLKIPKEVTEELINFCHKNKKILILTPCRPDRLSITDPNNIKLIDKISIITCNKQECMTMFNTENIEECVKKYPNKLIVTLGAEGLIYYNGKRIIKMPAIETEVVDTTGAGDTLNGNLSAFLAKGMDLKHALRKAMYASTMKLKVKSAQTGMPFLEDLEIFIRNYRNKDFTYNKELNLILNKIKYAYERVKYKPFEIREKFDSTLVTDTDIEIENYLIDQIKEVYPNDNFLTEEHYPDNKLINRTWIIDPIDGTNHYIKKDGFWGIQLAFYDKEKTRFSVIYLPERKELFYAAENIGVFKNNEKILEIESSPLEYSVIEFGGSISKSFETKEKCLKKLIKDNKLQVANIYHVNSSCISYTNLIQGKTDALILATNKPWDIMPGEFMAQECGIKTSHIDVANNVRLLTNNEKIEKLIIN